MVVIVHVVEYGPHPASLLHAAPEAGVAAADAERFARPVGGSAGEGPAANHSVKHLAARPVGAIEQASPASEGQIIAKVDQEAMGAVVRRHGIDIAQVGRASCR